MPSYAAWTQRSAREWPGFAADIGQATAIDVALRQPGGVHVCLTQEELDARVSRMAQLAQSGYPLARRRGARPRGRRGKAGTRGRHRGRHVERGGRRLQSAAPAARAARGRRRRGRHASFRWRRRAHRARERRLRAAHGARDVRMRARRARGRARQCAARADGGTRGARVAEQGPCPRARARPALSRRADRDDSPDRRRHRAGRRRAAGRGLRRLRSTRA